MDCCGYLNWCSWLLLFYSSAICGNFHISNRCDNRLFRNYGGCFYRRRLIATFAFALPATPAALASRAIAAFLCWLG